MRSKSKTFGLKYLEKQEAEVAVGTHNKGDYTTSERRTGDATNMDYEHDSDWCSSGFCYVWD